MENNNPKVVKTSDITCRVGLDEQNVPVKIEWMAQDSPDTPEFKESKAMLVSFFDKDYRDTYKIDLWTKDMPVDEMKLFFHQTLVSLTDTFMKATQDEKMTATMKDFCEYFAEKMELK